MEEKIKLPKEIIYLCEKVIPLKDIYIENKNTLKPTGAVYCFWWLGDKKTLLNPKRMIGIKGPGERYIILRYENWFPKDLPYIPLYVGKTIKLKSRISQHLLSKSTCQLRAGIEHIFPNEEKPKDFILKNIGLSFVKKSSVEKRFYLEDFAVGYLRPWFNLDSER